MPAIEHVFIYVLLPIAAQEASCCLMG